MQSWTILDISLTLFLLVVLCGIFVGMAKAGVPGVGLAIVPLMAEVFGSRPSTGILLPMLIMADIFAVIYYNRHAEWKFVLKLLPWALLGVISGALFGKRINDTTFTLILSSLVIIGAVLMLVQDVLGKKMNVPNYWWFAALMGFLGGFSTMIANAAGPVMALYLLSMRLPKNVYIGTGAWFFFIINVLKVPLHIFSWETITFRTFLYDVFVFPAILLGVFIGIKLVKKIPERIFKILIIATTIVAAIILLKKYM